MAFFVSMLSPYFDQVEAPIGARERDRSCGNRETQLVGMRRAVFWPEAVDEIDDVLLVRVGDVRRTDEVVHPVAVDTPADLLPHTVMLPADRPQDIDTRSTQRTQAQAHIRYQ